MIKIVHIIIIILLFKGCSSQGQEVVKNDLDKMHLNGKVESFEETTYGVDSLNDPLDFEHKYSGSEYKGFNEKGYLILEIHYNHSGTILSTTTYEYNNSGDKLLKSIYDYGGHKEVVYHPENEISVEKVKKNGDSLTTKNEPKSNNLTENSKGKDTYEYDEHKNWIKWVIDENKTPIIIIVREIQYYNE